MRVLPHPEPRRSFPGVPTTCLWGLRQAHAPGSPGGGVRTGLRNDCPSVRGTGGGGFRFIYAAFLQEASEILALPQLKNLADEMTEIGDLWRYFALLSARNCKGREGENSSFPGLAALLIQCGQREKALFSQLYKTVR